MIIFSYGVILAFGLILPLGIQNVFVLSQAMSNPNKKQLLAVVITSSLSDTLLIALSTFGLSELVLLYPFLMNIFLLVGITFIFYLGVISYYKPINTSQQKTFETTTRTTLKLIYITLIISLFNPYAWVDIATVIGTTALSYTDISERIIFISGCIFTSWVWFFSLGFLGKNIIRFEFIKNYQYRISGIIMITIALMLLGKFLQDNFCM